MKHYELIVTQGFDHVASSIFQDLKDVDLANARSVCKHWYLYISKQKFYWRRILIKAQRRSHITNPEWKSLLESILEVNEFQDLYTMGSIMQEFYATSIPRSKCENILTPYYVAAWNGNLDHLEFLWPHFKDKNPRLGCDEDSLLHAAVERGHTNVVKFIVNKVPFKNPCSAYGETPLHIAAENGKIAIVEAIIYSISDRNPRNMFGDTPLHRAAKNGHTEIARIFMNAVAESDNNPPNCDGITPLHNAARNGHWKTVKLFIDKKNYLDTRTDSGDTPLHFAAKNGHLKVTQILLEAKASTMLCNVNGDTPMHLAVKFGHAEVVQCLMKLKKAKIPSQRSTEASQVIKKPKKGFSTPTHSLHLPDQENVIDFHKSTPCLKVEPIESHSVSHEVKNSSLSNLNLCPTPNMEILQSAKGSRRNSLDSIKCSIL